MFKDVLVTGLSNHDITVLPLLLLSPFHSIPLSNAPASSIQQDLRKISCNAVARNSAKGRGLEYKASFQVCKIRL